MQGAKSPAGGNARTHTARPAAKGGVNGAPPAQRGRPSARPKPAFSWPKDPFERTEYGDVRPKTVDWKTRAALMEAERRLGYRLTIVQGSYNAGGVSASGGTHDQGGVVDLLAWDWKRKVKVLRKVGFAAWYRPTRAGLWNEHIHAVLVDHGNLSDVAKRQVIAYRAGRDGLKSNDLDPFWRPTTIPVFRYPPPPVEIAPVPEFDPDPVEPLASAFPPRRTLDGVDTSHHQGGRIDVKAAQAAGVRWWYVKATEGTTFVDSTYRRRVREARRAGMPIGAYHFARPDGDDAAAEARFFLEHSDIRVGDMLPMLDLEEMEDLSLSELTTWTGIWVTTVKRTLAGRGMAAQPIIYTRFNLGDGFGCMLWVARYSDDFRAPAIPTPWRRAAIWQHSDGQFGAVKNVPGFGAVDANAQHPDVPLSALRVRPKGPKTAIKPKPDPRSAAATATAPANAPAPVASDRDDLVDARDHLRAAAQSIQAALAAIPKE